MGWCMREPYCPLPSAVCNATIPTLPNYLKWLNLHVRRSVTFIVHKIYVSFLSRMHDWTVAVAQYSCLLKYSIFENMAV
jgi:hypothetical protein